jgi:hypothetical protein
MGAANVSLPQYSVFKEQSETDRHPALRQGINRLAFN